MCGVGPSETGRSQVGEGFVSGLGGDIVKDFRCLFFVFLEEVQLYPSDGGSVVEWIELREVFVGDETGNAVLIEDVLRRPRFGQSGVGTEEDYFVVVVHRGRLRVRAIGVFCEAGTGLSYRAFEGDLQQFLCFHSELHRQFVHHFFGVAVDD